MTWGERWWVGSELKSNSHQGCASSVKPHMAQKSSCTVVKKDSIEWLVFSRNKLFIRIFGKFHLLKSLYLSVFLVYLIGCISLPQGRAVIFQLRSFRFPTETLNGTTTMSSDISYADSKICPLWSSLCKTCNIQGVERVSFWKLKPGIIPQFFILCIWN